MPPQNKNYYNAPPPQGFNKSYPIRKPMPYKPYPNKDGFSGGRGRVGRRFYKNYHNPGPNYGPPPMEGMNPQDMNYRNGLPPPPAFDYYGNPLDFNVPPYPNPAMRIPPPNINPMIIDYGSSENETSNYNIEPSSSNNTNVNQDDSK